MMWTIEIVLPMLWFYQSKTEQKLLQEVVIVGAAVC